MTVEGVKCEHPSGATLRVREVRAAAMYSAPLSCCYCLLCRSHTSLPERPCHNLQCT